MKKIAVLGITGSIGLSVVEIVRKQPELFKITFATSHNNSDMLISLAEELQIADIALTGEDRNERANPILTGKTDKYNRNLYYGRREVLEILAAEEFDIVINAVSGSSGLIYTHRLLKNGQTVALANKESLVMAGHLFGDEISKKLLIPVDSEHSALMQILNGLTQREIRKVILTASGGPFRDLPILEFSNISPAEALKHPTWSMGAKITIDSATMFNKGLEVIEAHWLFNLPYHKLDAVIHPQSVVHSFVECSDGSILAQMSRPDMQLPILFALTYPEHIDSDLVKTNLTELPPLTFSAIDSIRYPLFKLAIEAGKTGGIMPTVLNAANEAAIKLFLESKISFSDIHRLAEQYLNKQEVLTNPDLETILGTNEKVYKEITGLYS